MHPGVQKKIDKDVYKLTEGREGGGVEALLIDGPQEQQLGIPLYF